MEVVSFIVFLHPPRKRRVRFDDELILLLYYPSVGAKNSGVIRFLTLHRSARQKQPTLLYAISENGATLSSNR